MESGFIVFITLMFLSIERLRMDVFLTQINVDIDRLVVAGRLPNDGSSAGLYLFPQINYLAMPKHAINTRNIPGFYQRAAGSLAPCICPWLSRYFQ
ncbi:MAG: hypothetical protein ACI915_002593 [Gammaproteobacteria bacterium]|jgi:hypothetical protein